jgi:hypothetical protein
MRNIFPEALKEQSSLHKPGFKRARFYSLRKNSLQREFMSVLYQGTTSQLAEKLVRAVGRDFSPGTKPIKPARALAPEGHVFPAVREHLCDQL